MEFFLFDVILNHALMPERTDGDANPDKVVMALAYDDEDIAQESSWKYQSAIAFLPGTGMFYCARERRKGNTLLNTLIPLDMSWLRITKVDGNLLKFGSDGYNRYFADRRPSLPVSGWRVTAGRASNQWRYIHRAFQCADHDGPRMPPDVIDSHDISCWPAADRACEYN